MSPALTASAGMYDSVGHEIIPAWLSRLCWEYFRGAGGRQLDPLAICGALTSLNSLGQRSVFRAPCGIFRELPASIDDRVHFLKQQVHAIVLALRDRDLNGVEQSKYLAPFVGSLGVSSLVVLPRPFEDVCKKRLYLLIDRHLMG
jgi:hypothetical protein